MRPFKLALTISLILAGGLVVALYQNQAQLEVVWGKQWGSAAFECSGSGSIALDGQGNIYISGVTEGNLFGQNQGKTDIFVVKLDSNGQVLWSKQFGTADEEEGAGLSVDAEGNAYVMTVTPSAWFGESLGDRDVVLLKLSADGQLLWGKRIGTNDDEFGSNIAVDRQGYVYIVGGTRGNLFAQYQGGFYEGFLAKFDSTGRLVWGKQFKDDLPDVIAVDSQGNIYVGGLNTYVRKLAYDDVSDLMVRNFWLSIHRMVIWFGGKKYLHFTKKKRVSSH